MISLGKCVHLRFKGPGPAPSLVEWLHHDNWGFMSFGELTEKVMFFLSGEAPLARNKKNGVCVCVVGGSVNQIIQSNFHWPLERILTFSFEKGEL